MADDTRSLSALTLEQWVHEIWLPSMQSQVKPSTLASYRRNCELHVLPYLGDSPLDELRPAAITALYGHLLTNGRRKGSPGGLSAKTVHYIHTMLHKLLVDAVDAELIAANPADRAKPPRPERVAHGELHFWTAEQLREFLRRTADTPLGGVYHLAAMTGMRRGEVLGLRWRDVDLGAGWLAVRHTVISVSYRVQFSTPKTHRSRVVDLDPATVDLLRMHRAHQQTDAPDGGELDLVFRHPGGEPLHPELVSQAFDRAISQSGLPRIRFHDLRHTHATLALRAGVPAKVVSERLGHTNPAFTLRQYAHVIPGMQAEAARQVANLVLGPHGAAVTPAA